MQLKRMFSSGSGVLIALLCVFAVAVCGGVYMRLHRPSPAVSLSKIAGAWGVERIGSGLAVNWNFGAPLLRDARSAMLEIEDGGENRQIPLNRAERSGTLFYAPRAAAVTLRLHIQPADPGTPEKVEVIRLGAETQQAVTPVQKIEPEVPKPQSPPQESSRARTEVPVSIWRVRAFAPPSLTNKLSSAFEVPVYVKIAPNGKVTSASTRKYENATEASLASIATGAALKWKFQPLKGRDRSSISRDFVLHFNFAPK
jgi:hypothetical protein